MRDVGLIWFSPILPMRAPECRELMGELHATIAEHGFDPLITLSSVSPRSLCCVTSLHFRKNSPEQRRAQQCYQTLRQNCAQLGYYPYRSFDAAHLTEK